MDPQLRKRLLQESQNPLRGPRRLLWFALFASACIGLCVMSLHRINGESVLLVDALIQIGAFILFGGLLWIDRPPTEN